MNAIERFAMAASAVCLMSIPAHATPADILVSGQMAPALVHGSASWCAVSQGTTTFQSNGTTTFAAITFPELTYFDGTNYDMLDGLGQMTFASASAGTIKFIDTGMAKHFSNFHQRYDGTAYHISFSIDLDSTCKLPIAGIFETP